GIIPDDLLKKSREGHCGHFGRFNMVLIRNKGPYPTTFTDTGLQWDARNAWHGIMPTLSSNQSTFNLIPAGQLGLEESQLPGQRVTASTNASVTGAAADINRLDGTVQNGGNATSGEGWARTLQRELANRYIASVLCSWRATGGSISGVLPRYSDAELNVTQSVNQNGNMFEKFSNLAIDSAGRGGEYVVQAGFGWTNGVLLWAASVYGDVLVAPQCPSLLESGEAQGGESSEGGNGESGGDAGNGSEGSGSNSAVKLSVGWTLGLVGILVTLLTL
ncbi:hypothetical protein MPER_08439, partial [Moniliophthora perniciosa FA553]